VNVTIWQVPPDREFLLRQWDGALIVYDCSTGDTHLLDKLASQIFHFLQLRPVNANVVVEHIASHFSLELDEDLTSEVLRILDNLVFLGLIQAV
jgi:PqqD family protein of HPr-rel-A system